MPFDQVCYDYGIINDGNNINFGMLKGKTTDKSGASSDERERERERRERNKLSFRGNR